MMSYETLKLEREHEALVVRLNRPEKLNAFNSRLISDLVDLCRELRMDLSGRGTGSSLSDL